MSAHRNIPVKFKDSIADNINNMSAVIQELSKEDLKSSKHGSGTKNQSSVKRKRTGSKKFKHSQTNTEHLDPKRQINLLDQSGLSDAIEANLSVAHRNSILDSAANRDFGDSATRQIKSTAKKVRPNILDGDDGLDERYNSSSQQTAQANAEGRICLSRNTGKKLKGKGTGNDPVVRSSKMFEDENLNSSNTGGGHFDEAAAEGESRIGGKNLESIP